MKVAVGRMSMSGSRKKMGALVLQSFILLGLAIYAITNWTATLAVAA